MQSHSWFRAALQSGEGVLASGGSVKRLVARRLGRDASGVRRGFGSGSSAAAVGDLEEKTATDVGARRLGHLERAESA